MILLDANVLVYAVNADAPQHATSRSVVERSIAGDIAAALVLQVLLEFYAVITHPRRVQHPLAPAVAWAQVAALRTSLPVLDVPVSTLTTLEALVQQQQPIGARVFDLSLIAQMQVHRITSVCTYNVADFRGIAGIEALTPEDVLQRFKTDHA